MNPSYTLEQLRQIEQAAEFIGIDLMQRAARSAADWVTANFLPNSTILIAVGAGNNGGDALWTGLNLHSRNFDVILFIPEPVKSPAAIKALKLCKENKLFIVNQLSQLIKKPDLLIDGLFGIGLNRNLSDNWQQIIHSLNDLHITTLALDNPSGLDVFQGIIYGAAIQATTTLTFLGDKPYLHIWEGAQLSGKVIVDLLDLPKSIIPKFIEDK